MDGARFERMTADMLSQKQNNQVVDDVHLLATENRELRRRVEALEIGLKKAQEWAQTLHDLQPRYPQFVEPPATNVHSRQ